MLVDPDILADVPAMTALRRDIHSMPELAFQETRTADIVRRELNRAGIPHADGIGGTGIVGILKRGSSSRGVGLRADMDALPIAEASDFAHASRMPGRMHACGHDGHTAMLLAAAHHLSRTGEFDGIIYFIFQPGEESGRGAVRMIEDGLFDRYPMEAVFGAHNWPNLGVGEFAVAPGPMMASCNEFRIDITGSGGHAALPELAIDPLQPACAITIALKAIVGSDVPSDVAVLSVTKIHAGDAVHVIPDSASIQGSVRTFADTVTDRIEARINQIADGISKSHGATAMVTFIRNCAPTVNSADEAEFVRKTLAELAGANAVQRFAPAMTAEDFSFMLQARPGCYFMIGNGEGDHRIPGRGMGPCMLHNASYDFNDALIPIGAMAWARIAERWLARA